MTKNSTEKTKSVSSTKKRAKPLRPDHVGDALRAALAKPKNWVRNDRQYIVEYSKANALPWHLGHAEHKSALSQLHARMRVHIPRDEAKLQAEVTAGEFVSLNGTKILGCVSASWNHGMDLIDAPETAVVDGMSHPAIINLIEFAQKVGDTAILAKNPKTGRSEIMRVAQMGAKDRGMFIASKTRDYSAIITKEAEKREIVFKLEKANDRITELAAQVDAQMLGIDAKLDKMVKEALARAGMKHPEETEA